MPFFRFPGRSMNVSHAVHPRATGRPASLCRRSLRVLFWGGAAFLLVALLESFTELDMAVQRRLLDRAGRWLVDDATHGRWRGLLYTTPKILLGLMGGLAVLAAGASFVSRWRERLASWRGPCLVLAGSLILGPLLVGLLKQASGIG